MKTIKILLLVLFLAGCEDESYIDSNYYRCGLYCYDVRIKCDECGEIKEYKGFLDDWECQSEECIEKREKERLENIETRLKILEYNKENTEFTFEGSTGIVEDSQIVEYVDVSVNINNENLNVIFDEEKKVLKSNRNAEDTLRLLYFGLVNPDYCFNDPIEVIFDNPIKIKIHD